MTTRIDIDELERVAKAATPGEWWLSENYGSVMAGDPVPRAAMVGDMDFDDADTAHVLAANPTTVLALIARVRELEAGLVEACTEAGYIECNYDRIEELRALAKGER